MALDDILAAIRRESKAEAAELLREGKRRARAVEREARERAEALAATIAERADHRAANTRRTITRDVDHELRKARLTAERARLEALFEELEAHLARSRDDPATHRAMTARLVEQALASLPGATVLKLDPRDEAAVRAVVGDDRLSLDPCLTTWGGVVICDDDRRRVDNTLEARLRARREDLLVLVGTTVSPATREFGATGGRDGP